MQQPTQYVVVVNDPNARPPLQHVQYVQQPIHTIPYNPNSTRMLVTQPAPQYQPQIQQVPQSPVVQQVVYQPNASPAPPAYQPQPVIQHQIQNRLQPQTQPVASEMIGGQHIQIWDGHKYEPLNKENEDKLDYVKWTGSIKGIFIVSILGLFLWIYLLVNSLINYYEKNGTLEFEYCDGSVEGYYSCYDDNVEFDCQDWEDCPSQGYHCWYQDDCAPYNGKTYSILVVRLVMIPTFLFYVWKCLKNIWKGVQLPRTEKSKKKQGIFSTLFFTMSDYIQTDHGTLIQNCTDKLLQLYIFLEFSYHTGCCKKCMKLPGVIMGFIYDHKINLRKYIDKWAEDKRSSDVAHNDDSEHGDFVYVMWTASILLTFAEFCVLDLPFQVLNLSSGDETLLTIACINIPLDIMIMLMLIWMRNCCNAKSMRCSNDLDFYPEKNLKFIIPLAGRLSVGSLTACMGLMTCVFSTFGTTAESQYAVWLIALNFYKGMISVMVKLVHFESM